MSPQSDQAIARLITWSEQFAYIPKNGKEKHTEKIKSSEKKIPVIGVTGTGGAGKSSLTDEWVRRFLHEFPQKTVAILSIDPTKQKTGGALLGDRIRMNAISSPRVYMRSLATRSSKSELSLAIQDAIKIVKGAGFDLVIIETSGIGQGDSAIVNFCDLSIYVMTSEFGAPTQLEKIDMIDYADCIVINKFDRKGSEDALGQVRKQYQRSHLLFEKPPEDMPVYGTIASQFHDPGVNCLFAAVIEMINEKFGLRWETNFTKKEQVKDRHSIIPNERQNYLQEVVKTIRGYHQNVEEQVVLARRLFQIDGTIAEVKKQEKENENIKGNILPYLEYLKKQIVEKLTLESMKILQEWEGTEERYSNETYVTHIRGKEVVTTLQTKVYLAIYSEDHFAKVSRFW